MYKQTNVMMQDSKQILAATIAHHTVYEKTRHLQRSPCFSMGNTFVPDGASTSSHGKTSFCAIADKGHFAFDNSCKWPIRRHIGRHSTTFYFVFVTSIFCGIQSKTRRSGNNAAYCSLNIIFSFHCPIDRFARNPKSEVRPVSDFRNFGFPAPEELVSSFIYLYHRDIHFSTKGRCEKREVHKNWSVVKPEKAAPITGTTLGTAGPVLADSRQ